MYHILILASHLLLDSVPYRSNNDYSKGFECRRISVTICARKGESEIKCLRIVYADKEKSSYEIS
jgi:hypothetical protein